MPAPPPRTHRFFLHLFGPLRSAKRSLPPGIAALGLTSHLSASSVQAGRTIVDDPRSSSDISGEALSTDPKTVPQRKRTDATRSHEFWALMRLQDLAEEDSRPAAPPPPPKSTVRKLFKRRG